MSAASRTVGGSERALAEGLIGFRLSSLRTGIELRSLELKIAMLAVVSCAALLSSGYMSAVGPRSAANAAAPARQGRVFMDETIIEKALLGELEEEGAANPFLSEVGWATYLDKNAGSSYNMNERVSMAEDGYFTPDIFSNPVDGARCSPPSASAAAALPSDRPALPSPVPRRPAAVPAAAHESRLLLRVARQPAGRRSCRVRLPL
jgi:hypothetical protein